MRTYIALFRGINVGGTGSLSMKDLVALLTELGATSVQTYIQSGNAVFCYSGDSPEKLGASILMRINTRFGFEPALQLWTREELEAAVLANPFPEAEALPATLHLGFLASVPAQPDLEAIEALRDHGEEFRLAGRVFYLKAPAGVGRSKLAARSEKLLGVSMTDRNWRTVSTLLEMARALAG